MINGLPALELVLLLKDKNAQFGFHMNSVDRLMKNMCFSMTASVPTEACGYLAMLPVHPVPHIKGDEVKAPLIQE